MDSSDPKPKTASPLKLLATLYQEGKTPVKVTPKAKFITPEIIDPIPVTPTGMQATIINFNFNFDPNKLQDTMDNLAKFAGLTASAVAVLGSAFARPERKIPAVKIPFIPKIMMPKQI